MWFLSSLTYSFLIFNNCRIYYSIGFFYSFICHIIFYKGHGLFTQIFDEIKQRRSTYIIFYQQINWTFSKSETYINILRNTFYECFKKFAELSFCICHTSNLRGIIKHTRKHGYSNILICVHWFRNTKSAATLRILRHRKSNIRTRGNLTEPYMIWRSQPSSSSPLKYTSTSNYRQFSTRTRKEFVPCLYQLYMMYGDAVWVCSIIDHIKCVCYIVFLRQLASIRFL